MMNSLIHQSKNLISEAIDNDFQKEKLIPVSAWVHDSLERLQADCQALLLEIICNRKIAQSQLQIVGLYVIFGKNLDGDSSGDKG